MIFSIVLLVGLQAFEIRANVLREIKQKSVNIDPILIGTYQFDNQKVDVYRGGLLSSEYFYYEVNGERPFLDIIVNQENTQRLYISYLYPVRILQDSKIIEPVYIMNDGNEKLYFYVFHNGDPVKINDQPTDYTVCVFNQSSCVDLEDEKFDLNYLEEMMNTWEKSKDAISTYSNKTQCFSIQENWRDLPFNGNTSSFKDWTFSTIKKDNGSGYVKIVSTQNELYKLTSKQMEEFDLFVLKLQEEMDV